MKRKILIKSQQKILLRQYNQVIKLETRKTASQIGKGIGIGGLGM